MVGAFVRSGKIIASETVPLARISVSEMTEGVVTVVLEVPTGGGARSTEPNESLTVDRIPALAFAAYGHVTGTLNPADGQPLDAIILGAAGRRTDSLQVKAIGVWLRNDGDHKIVVVSTGSDLESITEVAQLPQSVQHLIARWATMHEYPGEHWGSAKLALSLIEDMKVNLE
jgi:inorganic pyrophosphatase